MTCQEINSHLSAYLDGALPSRLQQAIEQHLAGCAACRAELASLAATAAWLRQEGRVQAPPDLAARVQQALEKEPLPRRWSVPSSLAAGLLLVLLLGGGLWYGLGLGLGPGRSTSVALKQEAAPFSRAASSDRSVPVGEGDRGVTNQAEAPAEGRKAASAPESDAGVQSMRAFTAPSASGASEPGRSGVAGMGGGDSSSFEDTGALSLPPVAPSSEDAAIALAPPREEIEIHSERDTAEPALPAPDTDRGEGGVEVAAFEVKDLPQPELSLAVTPQPGAELSEQLPALLEEFQGRAYQQEAKEISFELPASHLDEALTALRQVVDFQEPPLPAEGSAWVKVILLLP